MTIKNLREHIKVWHAQDLGNLELVHAIYDRHSLPRHIHEEFSIGVMVEGNADVSCRGAKYAVYAGSLITLNPGEAHAHQMIQGSYKMLYPPTTLLKQIDSENAGREKDCPFFPKPIVHDRYLSALTLKVHSVLEKEAIGLRREALLLELINQLIVRLTNISYTEKYFGEESQVVKQIQEYLEAYYFQNITLQELGKIFNLSSFYLSRVFSKKIGLSIHSYLIQTRIKRAKKLLLEGWKISHVAHKTGFVDQCHLTKHFKRFVGVTPKQYLRHWTGCS